MSGQKVLAALAAVVLGAGLMASPALAKCSKDCKKAISAQFHTCKAACAKKDKACKKACTDAKKAAKAKCKAATPPACSPSGAFVG